MAPRWFAAFGLLLLLLFRGIAAAQTMVLDDFRDASRWQAAASDQVKATLRRDGEALCLDYDFNGVSGYAFMRRDLPIELPAHYEFRLKLQGSGPPNDLQMKLVDASGDNVWWMNRPNHRLPSSPTTLRIKRRMIDFAWGPTQDRTLKHPASIEFVIAAGRGGGKGSLCLHELSLLALPPPSATPPDAVVESSAGQGAARLLQSNGAAGWSAPAGAQTLTFDFREAREFNGLLLPWQPGAFATDYEVQTSDDGRSWTTIERVTNARTPLHALFMPESESRYLRLALAKSIGSRYGLQRVELPTPGQWPTQDAMFKTRAGLEPDGRYPRAYRPQQNYWTLVGVDGGAQHSALVSEDGAIELGRGAPSIEPFVRLSDGTLVSWAAVQTTHTLRDGYLPMPSVQWKHAAFTLSTEVAAEGKRDAPTLLVRHRVRNGTDRELRLELLLAARPFQVNPPQQFLSTQGGVSPVRSLAWQDGRLRLNDTLTVQPVDPPARVLASRYHAGPVLDAGEPLAGRLDDPQELAEAALVYPLVVPPHGERVVAWTSPLAGADARQPTRANGIDARFDAVAAHWRERLNRLQLKLPPAARPIHDTLRSTLAQILMSRNGPALQPGTRSYARSWIRDGAMMEAGLLRVGEVDAVREFIDWFAPRIFASGKVPCCIDQRGADPVVENDSHGEFIYAVAEQWRHTRDPAALQRLWPKVESATRYMESLRQSERIPANREGDRASWWGLMPRSISHEGYSEKPMHAYWDNFWALRGYKDAVEIAAALGRDADAKQFARWRDEFQADLVASIRTAAKQHGIGFIPGAAELGDYDPTSITVGLNPAQAGDVLPPELLAGTFDRYWHESVKRRDGQRDWNDYTPYELRNVGAFTRLGYPQRAHAMLAFFFGDQRPRGWNQWAEVVARDPRLPRFLGDMPHAWVSSDYIRSALDLFAYERDADRSIVIGAGIPSEWLDDEGIAVSGLSTPYGRLGYRMKRLPNGDVQLDVDAGSAMPPGGLVLRWAADGALPAAQIDGRLLNWQERELRIDRQPARVLLKPAR